MPLWTGPSPQSNFTATTDPTTASDSVAGYSVGSSWLNSTTQVIWRCTDATASAAIWVAMQVSDHPGYRTGLYYSTFEGTNTTGTPVVDTGYIYPYYVREKFVLTGTAVRSVGGGTTSNIKMAVYANSQTAGSTRSRPIGAPLAVNNTGAATTGANSDISLAMSVSLSPGSYWFYQKHNGTPSTFTTIATGNSGLSALIGKANSLGTPVLGLSMADTYTNNCPTLTGSESWSNVVTAIVPIMHIGD